ncbi:MAG TPA: heparan-alpha-glucosaminide N-acetyltransferase domain-containing protein [Bryobacteraceae bacterium]|nr:heparan-alpha-glucosaminide N-acetyltransferase domain-containing protein [Bryobacteraceae bacterium]
MTPQLEAAAAGATQSKQPATKRLVSLDVFRGATMALMVLVNDAGDGSHTYGPLKHSVWNGWTLTDTVFPAFLWIVGVTLTLSMNRRIAAGAPRSRLFLQVLRRAAILYLLGLVVYAWPLDLSTQRLLGVLQRIAICYLAASAIYLTTGIRGQLIWIASLLGGYWLLMMLVPVPGYGAGHLDVQGNFAHYVDSLVLGRHNYAHTKTWDPEGIISTLPAIATALFGVMAGHILRLKRELAERTTWLFLTGNLLIAAGLICNVWLPINKSLWTSSFSLFMAGLDFVVFAMCLWLVDGLGIRRPFMPAVVIGMNPITVYMISELLDELLGGTGLRERIYQSVFVPIASPYNASLLYALSYTLLLWLIAYGMYRRGWFWRV